MRNTRRSFPLCSRRAKALQRERGTGRTPHAMAEKKMTTGILALEGEIDLHRSEEIKETLRPLIDQKTRASSSICRA